MDALRATAFYLVALELSTDHSSECHGLPRKFLLLLAAVLKQHLVTLGFLNYALAKRLMGGDGLKALRNLSLFLHAGTALRLIQLLKRQYDSRLHFALRLSSALRDNDSDRLTTIGKWSMERVVRGLTPLYSLKVELLASRLLGFGTLRSLHDIHYTGKKVHRQSLDVFFHLHDLGRKQTCLKVVVWAHGGGWVGGDKRMAPPLFSELARSGYVVVAPNYRYVNPSKCLSVRDQVKDLKCAIAWTKSNLAEVLDQDPSLSEMQVFVGGSSAGSHLAMCCACTQNDPAYQPVAGSYRVLDTSLNGCIDVFGPKSLMPGNKHAHRLFGKGFDDFLKGHLVQEPFSREKERAYADLSPLQMIQAESCKVPPMFGVHGTFDCWVAFQESRDFYDTLERQRTEPCLDTFVEVPGAPHGFHLMNSSWAFSLADALRLWLDKVSGHKAGE